MKNLLKLSFLLFIAMSCNKNDLQIENPSLSIEVADNFTQNDFDCISQNLSFNVDTMIQLQIIEKYITNSKIEELIADPDKDSALIVTVETQSGDMEVFVSGEALFTGCNISSIRHGDSWYCDLTQNLFLPISLLNEKTALNHRVEISNFESDQIIVSYTSRYTGLSIRKKF